jgi:hypothetical protein
MSGAKLIFTLLFKQYGTFLHVQLPMFLIKNSFEHVFIETFLGRRLNSFEWMKVVMLA